MDKIFGTDGIRGRVNYEMNVDLALKVGKSLKLLNQNKVVVGYDTRLSNKMLTNALISGALSQNLEVEELGVMSTPMVQYYSKLNKCIGVMITASHNPYYDNGIKIFKDGIKIDKEDKSLIETYLSLITDILSYDDYNATYTYNNDGSAYLSFLNPYISSINLKIGLDLANGVYSNIAPKLFTKITNNLVVTANSPNGYNINENVGSTNISNLIDIVKTYNIDLGFAYDGDGDRVIAVEKGKEYDGNLLIYIIANHFNYQRVVLTKIANQGIVDALKRKNIDVYLADVGDYNVYKMMLDNSCPLGGEASGHLIASEFSEFPDGLLISLIIIKIINESKKSLAQLVEDVIIYPSVSTNIDVNDKAIVNDQELTDSIAEINKTLGCDGHFICRASGTQPCIRLTGWAKNEKTLKNLSEKIIELIKELKNKYER